MNRRPLRVEHALDLLPALDDLLPLREALIGGSRSDTGVGGASEAYTMVDMRVTDAAALEAELPAMLTRVRERTEAVYRHSIAALRSLEGGDAAGAARSLVAAGEVEEEAGRLDAAERFYARALEVGRRPRDRSAEGLALRRLGRVARARGLLGRSVALYTRGYEVAEALGDREGMVVACQGTGNALVEQGRWSEAESWYRRGLALIEGDPPSRHHWQLQSNLSAVARRSGRLEDSARWLAAARRTVDEVGDVPGLAYVFNAMGLLLVAQGEPERATAAYEEALRHTRAPAETARALVNLAEALLVLGKVDAAEWATRRLEQIALTHGLIASLPYVYRGLGAVARARGDENGFVFYEQALELCRGQELPAFELGVTQREYAEFEAELGSVDSALARLEEARRIFSGLGAAPELAQVDTQITRLRLDRVGRGPETEERP